MIVKNKKIALISAINNNYGTMLQAYAVQTILEKEGLQVDIFNYVSNPIKQLYRILNLTFLKTKLKSVCIKIITLLFYPSIYKNIKVRENAFKRFKNNHLNLTDKINSKNELSKIIVDYDAAVLGSDQVWNPQNLEMDYYTLNFVPDDIPKITYAPSFGVECIPKYQISRTKKYLSRIEHISTRELQGSEIIKDLIGRDAVTVCDPTALLGVSDWNKLKSSKKYINSEYIFCYFLGRNIRHRNFANYLGKLLNCKIVSIQHMDEFVNTDLQFSDLAVFDVEPGDFLSLIDNARVVVTDSFHGTMFSIYYNKPFYVLNYSNNKDKNSVNSRIDSISEILKLDNRRIVGNERIKVSDVDDIDWELINKKLASFVDDSMNYLKNALIAEHLIYYDRD